MKTQTTWMIGIAAFLLSGFAIVQPADQHKVEGVIVSDATGKPIPYAHVYIVHGEEEALTNNKGEFSINTAASFPLTVTATHKEYITYKWSVASPGQRQHISLKQKGK